MKPFKIIIVFTLFIISCDKNNAPITSDSDPSITGTSSFVFDSYLPFADKPMNVFYHVPENINTQTPILFVLHGSGRNAAQYRDAFINKSEQLGFIVVVPEFNDIDFPGGDAYNLANIFEDGDNPSASSLNDESDWTISVLDPIFDHVRDLTDNETSRYDLFGHSAGSQVAHRFLLFKPTNKTNKVILSAAGWYTVPNISIDFPYGLNKGPFIYSTNILEELFFKNISVIVGTEDNDPNAASLRHTDEAELQGAHRLARAEHFFNESQNIASQINSPFNWQFQTVPNVGHQYNIMAGVASELLYN